MAMKPPKGTLDDVFGGTPTPPSSTPRSAGKKGLGKPRNALAKKKSSTFKTKNPFAKKPTDPSMC